MFLFCILLYCSALSTVALSKSENVSSMDIELAQLIKRALDFKAQQTLLHTGNVTTTTPPVTCKSIAGSTNTSCELAKLFKEYHYMWNLITFWRLKMDLDAMNWFIEQENTAREAIKTFVLEQVLEKKLVKYRGNDRIEKGLKAALKKLRKKRPDFVTHPHNFSQVAALACKFGHFVLTMAETVLKINGTEVQDNLEERLKLSNNETLEKAVEEERKAFKRIDFETLLEGKRCDGDNLERKLNPKRVVEILGAWIKEENNKTIYTDLSNREMRLIREMKNLRNVHDNQIEKDNAIVLGRPATERPVAIIGVMEDSLRLVLQKANYLTETLQDSKENILAKMTDLQSSRNFNLLNSIRNIGRILTVRKMLAKISPNDKVAQNYLEAQLKDQEDFVNSDLNKTKEFQTSVWSETYKLKLLILAALKDKVDNDLYRLLKLPEGQERRKNFGPEIAFARSTKFTKVIEDTILKIKEIMNDKKTLSLEELRTNLLEKLKNDPERKKSYRYYLKFIKDQPEIFVEVSKSMDDYENELRNGMKENNNLENKKLSPLNYADTKELTSTETTSTMGQTSEVKTSNKKLLIRKINKPTNTKTMA